MEQPLQVGNAIAKEGRIIKIRLPLSKEKNRRIHKVLITYRQ
jgi:hypothetical protein